MTSFEMNAEGQACLRALIIHDRAADRRHPDGQDYTGFLGSVIETRMSKLGGPAPMGQGGRWSSLVPF
jgi:hypothetical protein